MKKLEIGSGNEKQATDAVRYYEARNDYKVEPWRFNLCVSYPEIAYKILVWTKSFEIFAEKDDVILLTPNGDAYKYFKQFVLGRIKYPYLKMHLAPNGYLKVMFADTGAVIGFDKDRATIDQAKNAIKETSKDINAKSSYIKKGSYDRSVRNPNGYEKLN